MNKKTSYLVVFLAIIAAFLLGMTVARAKYSQKATAKPTANNITPTAVPTPPFTPPKTGKPEIKFFVMSFCPYGNQTEAGLEPVYQLLKEKVSWQPRYIVSEKKSTCEKNCPYKVFNDQAKTQCQQAIQQGQIKDMVDCQKYFPYTSADECLKKECANLKAGEYTSLHGTQELNQDVREICAFNTAGSDTLTKWWKFVGGVNDKCTANDVDTCWQELAKAAGFETGKISTCFQSQFKTLLDKEIAETDKYQVSGSPTIIINGSVYNGNRSPEDYKKAICSAFENSPAECSQTLAGGSTSVSGGCGN